ncbi:MAG: bile acid:sodium symporter family protein [Spirochaetes bacterium]|nr:bile acid:sodium symporter family protein [Spirochaetota bacterium]
MSKIVRTFTRLLPVWTVLAVLVGYYRPQSLILFQPYLEWMFAFTMLGIGAVLNFEDFLPIIKKPHLVLLGTMAQFGIMPASAYAISRILNFPDELALGLILAGSVPGAMASNVISYLAKADVAYSISLTSTSTLLSPILTPAFTYLFAHTIIQIQFWPMFFSIIKIVIIPLFIGFAIRHIFKKIITGVQEIFPAFSTIFIAFICGLIVALNKNYLLSVSFVLFAGIFLQNLAGLAGGYGAGLLYKFDIKRRRTLSIEVGMQNAGLGAVLALKHFSEKVAIPSALFATWCVITASILAEFWSSRTRPSE